MQLVHNHNKSKNRKLSEAGQFAKILAAKWRVQDKAKAEIDVKALVNQNPVPNVKSSKLSTADPLNELERLTDLLNRKLINESEFRLLKNRIFN